MNLRKLYSHFMVVCLFQLSIVSMTYGQDNWVKFKADAVISFQVEVPAEMGVKTKIIPTDMGEMTTTTYAHEGQEGDANFLYVINVIEYPVSTFPEDSLDLKSEFLDEAILSIADGVAGEIVYQSELPSRNNGLGKLFRLKYNDGFGVIKGKTFIKDDVFITLQVYTTRDNSLNDDMDLFLDSFKAMF